MRVLALELMPSGSQHRFPDTDGPDAEAFSPPLCDAHSLVENVVPLEKRDEVLKKLLKVFNLLDLNGRLRSMCLIL
jgi:hypothetical protein